MATGLFHISVLPKQLRLEGGHRTVTSWMKASESREGMCFVDGQGDLVFFHKKVRRGHLLFCMKQDWDHDTEGQIIEPSRRIAVFKRS